MVNKLNVEKFYDYFDYVANILYEKYGKTYLEGMNEAFNYLLDDEFSSEYNVEDEEKLTKAKLDISDVQFSAEEVRKSVQLGLLKGYKHSFSSNSLITPDTIGIFIGYLLKKLYKNRKLVSILDPLVGTGNLVYTVINHLEQDIKVFGIDDEILKCNLARNLGDLLDSENEIFCQDTLSYYDQGFDLVLTDMPFISDEDNYLPYQVINHHLDGLVEGGYCISIIDNDFFEKKNNEVFKEEIDKKAYIFGLIKLSETLFKTNPKSILIIRKKGDSVAPSKDFLLVDLPSFNDINSFNDTINDIDLWMSKREEDL